MSVNNPPSQHTRVSRQYLLSKMSDVLAPWAFDVSSLMVLIGEAEERRFRSSRGTLAEVLVAAPVAGIQSYLTSFEAVNSRLTYFSPYGCKEAPLRNMKLQSAISHLRLLDNGRYAAYKIKDDQKGHGRHKYGNILLLWLALTWAYLAALILVWKFAPIGSLPSGTWVGITNLSVLTGWSIIVRAMEYTMIKTLEGQEETKSSKLDRLLDDGIFFLGKRNSGLVICGSRHGIKMLTSTLLDYEEGRTYGMRNRHLQALTRVGTILVLLLVFITVPNGSTTDQLVFVLLNILAQFNVFLGLHLNSKACIEQLEPDPPNPETAKQETSKQETSNHESPNGEIPKQQIPTRTHIWAYIIRHFKGRYGVDDNWIEKSRMLPDTNVWEAWKTKVQIDVVTDPKDLYEKLVKESRADPSGFQHGGAYLGRQQT